MKLIIYFSTLLILAIAPYASGTINYRDKAITLISFDVNINSETKRFLAKFENLFQSTSKPDADKIISRIKDLAWGTFVDTIQDNVGMIILPLNTLDSSIGYDVYGFPSVNIGKAQKKGTSKYFMKIDLQIGPEPTQPIGTIKKDTSSQFIKLKEGEIRPMVTIIVTTYSNNGILPIGKYTGSALSPYAWEANNDTILDGMVNENLSTNQSTLMNLIIQAITNLSKNIH
jgi:hypothetical protein